MQKFKSRGQAQRFLSAHLEVYNLFNLGRHRIFTKHYPMLKSRSFASWKSVVTV